MVALAAALVLSFLPHAGWATGASGSTHSAYGGAVETSAWTAYGVRYRDRATADPPNATLRHLPPRGVVVWAVAFEPATPEPPIRLALGAARHLPCCEGEPVAGGEWELAGSRGSYSMIVRIYFGSRPTRPMRAEAAQALTRLRFAPAARLRVTLTAENHHPHPRNDPNWQWGYCVGVRTAAGGSVASSISLRILDGTRAVASVGSVSLRRGYDHWCASIGGEDNALLAVPRGRRLLFEAVVRADGLTVRRSWPIVVG